MTAGIWQSARCFATFAWASTPSRNPCLRLPSTRILHDKVTLQIIRRGFEPDIIDTLTSPINVDDLASLGRAAVLLALSAALLLYTGRPARPAPDPRSSGPPAEMASAPLKVLRVPATGTHTATIIWLHGLGDSGSGWSFLAELLGPRFSHIAWQFPNAPMQPVTVNMGMMMPAWYDIADLGSDIDRKEDEAGTIKSANAIQGLISAEVDAGIPADRIMLGGFSQGSVTSCFASLTSERRLAGVAMLSGYLPLRKKMKAMRTDASKSLPWFVGHGKADPVVPYKWGELSAKLLQQELGMSDVTFKGYDRLQHSASDQEIEDLAAFIARVLPPDAKAKA